MNNLIIKNLSNSDDELLNIKELWNHELGFIFPFYNELLTQKIYNCQYYSKECSFGAYYMNKLVGFIISKIYDNNPVMDKYINKGWISLLFVQKNYRKMGIGTKLLCKSESELRNKGVEEILVGSDYNNFFPGIPCDFFNSSENFFKKNGYELGGFSYDVIRKMDGFIPITSKRNNFNIRYAKKEDEKIVLDFFEKNFYGRWYYEAKEFFDNYYNETSYLIALDKDIVVGFLKCNKPSDIKISYNINWNKKFNCLEGFGPLGVDKDYRKLGISADLLNFALNNAYYNKTKYVLIDWTGLISMYQIYGFEVWKSYRHANKKIK